MLLEGYPVEAQFNSPFRLAVAEAALWRGDPETALATILDGIREIETATGRLPPAAFRMGFGAAAEMAEVARARREPRGEQAAIEAGAGLWASLQPILARMRASQQGQAAGRDRCRGRDDRRGTGRLHPAVGCRLA